MRLPWRTKKKTSESTSMQEESTQTAQAELAKAKKGLEEVKGLSHAGQGIAGRLAEIRKENHFKEIWNEGLRGGG